jgi:hypothetical protein
MFPEAWLQGTKRSGHRVPARCQFPQPLANALRKNMNPIDIELHDARIRELIFNPVRQIATLTVDAYSSPSSSERRGLQIVFEGVIDFHSSMDAIALVENFKAGNVNYWSPAVAPRRTHIYFSDGHIEILAAQLSIAEVDGGRA